MISTCEDAERENSKTLHLDSIVDQVRRLRCTPALLSFNRLVLCS